MCESEPTMENTLAICSHLDPLTNSSLGFKAGVLCSVATKKKTHFNPHTQVGTECSAAQKLPLLVIYDLVLDADVEEFFVSLILFDPSVAKVLLCVKAVPFSCRLPQKQGRSH